MLHRQIMAALSETSLRLDAAKDPKKILAAEFIDLGHRLETLFNDASRALHSGDPTQIALFLSEEETIQFELALEEAGLGSESHTALPPR
ncbi:MAG: hypothetical protein AAB690_00200 [Patescibacteria group bacterium]